MDKKATILVIDDDRGIRDLLLFTLQNEGYNVLTAQDGEEGIKMAAEQEIDIVVTDIMMPKIGGLTVLKKVKETKPSIEIIIVTAYGSMETAIDSLRKGAFDYINKPINLEELSAKISKAFEQKQLKSQLISLKEYDRMKDEFFSMITHEIKSPLTTILCAVEAQMNSKLHGNLPQKQFLEIIQNATTRMRSLVNDLLDYAKMEAGCGKIEARSFQAAELIDATIKEVKLLADQKKITIINKNPLNAKPDEAVIEGDFRQLQRVMGNLIINAINYTQESGTISAGYEKDERETRFVVEDNGKGIEKGALNVIFDRFYRVKQASDENDSGFGLGLSICKKIIELHKGKIWAESEGLGKGSRFIFSIPSKG